ncbi:hypothetical protein SDC9_14630 [bioreactor metagenome]|uniref:Spore protein YkvP/CgeB glycosyl transferase-like domain-containing protein n=1 Tax=bioreactor metagenome TaxID=1076179 RepID=A0A644TR09_9ZZZZ
MKIVYVGRFPLHIQSGHIDLISDIAATGHEAFYIIALRFKDYIRNKFTRVLSNDAEFTGINYRPFLRVTRKMKEYEKKCILSTLRKNGLIERNVVIVSNNMETCSYLKDRLPSEVSVIYHIFDRYSEYYNLTDEEKVSFDEREFEVIKKVDGVLCVSQKLLAEAKELNNNSFWFPGAVRKNQIVMPGAINTSSKKVGMISNELSRIDWPLMCNIAMILEDYSIELIGQNDLADLGEYPSNIRFIGKVPFVELPKYVRDWRVGLALYEENRFNEYCCPLKYFEYSSLDIPTISTTIPEGEVFANLYPEMIFLADDAKSIAAHVRNITTANEINDYTRLARDHNWSARAEQLIAIINKVKKNTF